MIAFVLYGTERKVLAVVAILAKKLVDARTTEELKAVVVQSEDELAQATQELAGPWDMACVDVGSGEGVDRIKDLRELAPDAKLLLVVNEGTSPMAYIRPGFMPSGIVMRPSTEAAVRQSVGDFVDYVLEEHEERSAAEGFRIELKEGITIVPFRRILCFESKAKRINVRLAREEYTYYDTLDRLEEVLPDTFLRCHRGFIVNRGHVKAFSASDSCVVLDDESRIPVSRSYKAKVREALA